jgi:hypothetical protein
MTQYFDFTFTRHAIHRFQVILIVHLKIGARVDSSDMEGKTHIVILQQQADTIPVTVGIYNPAFCLFSLL